MARLQRDLPDERDPLERALAQLEISTLATMYTSEELAEPSQQQHLEAIRIESKRTGRRKAYTGLDNRRPFLRLPTLYTRAALRWFFGNFPRTDLKKQMKIRLGGDAVYNAIDISLKFLFNLPSWEGIQRQRVMELFDQLSLASGENLKTSPSSTQPVDQQ